MKVQIFHIHITTVASQQATANITGKIIFVYSPPSRPAVGPTAVAANLMEMLPMAAGAVGGRTGR